MHELVKQLHYFQVNLKDLIIIKPAIGIGSKYYKIGSMHAVDFFKPINE